MISESLNIFKKYTDEETFKKIKEFDNFNEMFDNTLKNYANEVAITYNGEAYTYEKLNEDALAFQRCLVEKGFKKGDRIGLYIKNSYEFVYAFVGAEREGLVACIIPPMLDDKQVFGISMLFALKGLVYLEEAEEKVALAKKMNPNLTFVKANEKALGNVTLNKVELDSKDDAVIMFTGGTTGKSKGALLSHGALMQGTTNGCYGIKDVFKQKYLLVLPFSHVFGLVRNLLTSICTGSNLFICMNNKDMFRDCAIFRPNIIVMVPALAEMSLNLSKQFKRNMLGDSLKTIICGAAMVPPYLVREYDKMGIVLLPGYGLTESANLVSGNPKPLEKGESVGYIYPHIEYKVVDGELYLKGKTMLTKYIGNDEENEKAFEDGWFKTGDLVRFDEEGMLYIVGRSKEIIVLSSGENISPASLEAKFNELDIVQDSQVYEDVDEKGSHFLALEVVPRLVELMKVEADDKNEYLMKKLNEVNNSLLPYERVNKIIIRDSDFQRSPSMKIIRYKKC